MSAALIQKQLQVISDEFSLYCVTASEIEFYLEGSQGNSQLDAFWTEIREQCAENGIAIDKTDKEKGAEQFEISLKPSNSPAKTALDTKLLKEILQVAAPAFGMVANFMAKPYADQPGNGLHINIHLADKNSKNIFYKDDETISGALQFSIGGLMTWLNPCMIVFAPSDNSYERFSAKTNAPVTVSWGGNNRTVAIRLPDTEHSNKRIEHRVAGSDADVELVMAVILAGIHYGLKNKCDPGEQIFGDASLPMYNLPLIIHTREEALERLGKARIFDGYFSVSDLLPAQK
jgi:glutamine synthetase